MPAFAQSLLGLLDGPDNESGTRIDMSHHKMIYHDASREAVVARWSPGAVPPLRQPISLSRSSGNAMTAGTNLHRRSHADVPASSPCRRADPTDRSILTLNAGTSTPTVSS